MGYVGLEHVNLVSHRGYNNRRPEISIEINALYIRQNIVTFKWLYGRGGGEMGLTVEYIFLASVRVFCV
jgi:hypothetical protein